ncbi:MAG TPA: hypothetical protein VKG23_11875, partial [Thermoanaerobaculia bacterium]|nr:hypothetical protein [Thermoanaerobaculia bacterium]
AWTTAVGKIAYPASSPFQDPAFRAEFLRRFRYSRLLEFYLTHPSRLRDTIVGGGEAALTLRHPRFGNFEHRAGFPAGAQTSSFALWSRARRSLPGHPLIWIGLLWVGNLAATASTYRRSRLEGRLAREGIVLLVLMAAVAFGVCVLSNAHGDLARHFYVFHALTDLLFVADVVWIVAALAVRRAPAAGA